MPFPRSQGFNNAMEEQAGDVFQRALLLDVFCEANEKLDNQLSGVIAEEVQTLLDRRRTTGIGGWSYFPHLRELPADADDLAQVMLAFLRSGRSDAVSEFCEPPLSVLLSDNANPDGSVETWIIPKEHDEELTLQAQWVESAWGTGADCEVNANLLYALWSYDRTRFSEIIDRGTRYILACQQPDGNWQGTWYHGPFYATWMCLRLLESTSPDSHAIVKGHEFLASRQNADGGWGHPNDSDPLNTSLALLGLATHKNGRTPRQEKIASALRWLQQTQDHDGGWKAVPFIKMELGRSTGRPWQTLTYQSRTISTLMAVKAAFAWSEVALSSKSIAVTHSN
jgi:squalene cyclase